MILFIIHCSLKVKSIENNYTSCLKLEFKENNKKSLSTYNELPIKHPTQQNKIMATLLLRTKH